MTYGFRPAPGQTDLPPGGKFRLLWEKKWCLFPLPRVYAPSGPDDASMWRDGSKDVFFVRHVCDGA